MLIVFILVCIRLTAGKNGNSGFEPTVLCLSGHQLNHWTITEYFKIYKLNYFSLP